MRGRARRTGVLLVLVSLTGCGSLEHGNELTAVGAILPLSGPEARSGECVLEGMRLAAQQEGLPLEILPRDAYGSTGSSLRRLADLADQPRVIAVVGGWRAASGRPLAAAADARHVPFVALSPLASPEVVARGAHGLHRVAALGAGAARFVLEDLNAKSAGIARAPDSDAAAVLASAFTRTFRAGGGVVRWTVEADADGKVGPPPNGSDPLDVIWVAGPGSLVGQLASSTPAAKGASFVVAEGWAWEHLESLASGGAKIHVMTWYSATDPSPRCRQFVEACTAAGIVPTPAHALGWDFVVAMREAAAAEDATREGVARALDGAATFDGVTGRLALGRGVETPAVSLVTGDGLRFLRRVGAGTTTPAGIAPAGGIAPPVGGVPADSLPITPADSSKRRGA